MNCQPHFERAGVAIPAVRLGMCAACLQGLPIRSSEEIGEGDFKNREKGAAYQRRYYEQNREKLAARQRRYCEQNREKVAAWERRI